MPDLWERVIVQSYMAQVHIKSNNKKGLKLCTYTTKQKYVYFIIAGLSL